MEVRWSECGFQFRACTCNDSTVCGSVCCITMAATGGTHTQRIMILGSNDHSKAKTWAPEALQGWDDSGFGACWSFLAGQKYASHCLTGNAFGFGMFMGLWHHCVGPPLYGITLPHDWHLFTELWYGYWYINGGSNYVSLSWKPCRQPVTWHRSAWIGKSARRV